MFGVSEVDPAQHGIPGALPRDHPSRLDVRLRDIPKVSPELRIQRPLREREEGDSDAMKPARVGATWLHTGPRMRRTREVNLILVDGASDAWRLA
jgi:hypothetical protein